MAMDCIACAVVWPLDLDQGRDFSFDSIADGEPVIGFGDLICSSQASII